MKQIINDKIDNLPLLPGVYLMKDKNNKIIYIGKAKKLKNRVPQYFLRPHEGKTQKMISEVEDFDIIITDSEREALILELNLVHKHNPKYNILLKDDRTFPYIEVTMEKDPMLKITRGIKKRNTTAFGPFPDSGAAYEVLHLLNRIYPFRKCSHIPKRECLYYHMHQCLGPCIELVTKEQYQKVFEEIKKFLNGDIKELKEQLKEKMMNYAQSLEFEKAKEQKDILDSIEYVIGKQNVQFDDRVDRDVLAFHIRQGYISIAVLMYRSGVLSGKDSQVFSYIGDEEESFVNYIVQFYEKNRIPKEIILPQINDIKLLQELLNTKIIIPIRGVKHDLLQMAGQNAVKGMDDQSMIKVIQSDKILLLEQLGNLLKIDPPMQIEMIDNSHLQGSEAVSAVVVFVNGAAAKKLYRKYKLKGEEKRDDTASMQEIITRRFTRMKAEGANLSDLVIVDGGINQLNSVKKALTDLEINIYVAGLFKDEKHRTRGLINQNGEEIILPNDNNLLFFLTRLQDEVHRFAISYHHNLRSKSLSSSILDEVDGIGDKRKLLLLKTFGSIQKIIEAPESELIQYVPKKIIKKIKEIRLKD